MLAAEFVSEIFARVRETVSQCARTADRDHVLTWSLRRSALGTIRGSRNNIDLFASGVDGALTNP